MQFVSKRLKKISSSLTVRVSQKARDLKSQGIEIISLSSGEPDFDTPIHIKKKAIEAINNGFTKYTEVDGIKILKEAIKKKFLKENHLSYELDQLTVGVGGKHVIYNLFMSSLDDNDEVIIPAPYWVSYPDIVKLCGGKAIILDTDLKDNFKISVKKLEKIINKKTKWIIINSPSNPTGSVYNKKELQEIASILLVNKHVNILTDDIYEHLIYDDIEFYNILNVAPELYDRTFIVNGVSKAFSMTGWRIGYGAGNNILIKSMSKIQSQSTTNPSSISQMAATEALNSEKTFLNEWLKKFDERRNYVVNFLNNVRGLECYKPSGAFYIFVSCKDIMNKKSPNNELILNDVDFAEYLLTYARVAIVPGSAFGASPFFRISYASSMESLREACENIKKAICNLK